MRIYLIGFMCSGKSTVGNALADKLGYPFIDLDKAIEEMTDMSVQEIFDIDGEEAFRKYEKDALRSTGRIDNVVVACGGGTPCFYDNVDWMNGNGITLYLQTSLDSIYNRKKKESKECRPLLVGKSKYEISQLLESRQKYYDEADYTIDANKTVEEIEKEIISLLY